MEIKIPEIEAREILLKYDGSNNQLLEWKQKFINIKNFKLTRSQCEYVVKYNNVTPKVARKFVDIVDSFGVKLKESKGLDKTPKKIWIEKLLCESDKAYHIWGKISSTDVDKAMWVPKIGILQEEKKLNRIIDYTTYKDRPQLKNY